MQYSHVLEKANLSKLGKSLSKEHKEKLSRSLKASGKSRSAKRLATMKVKYPNGYKQSKESNLKRSIALKGRPKIKHR